MTSPAGFLSPGFFPSLFWCSAIVPFLVLYLSLDPRSARLFQRLFFPLSASSRKTPLPTRYLVPNPSARNTTWRGSTRTPSQRFLRVREVFVHINLGGKFLVIRPNGYANVTPPTAASPSRDSERCRSSLSADVSSRSTARGTTGCSSICNQDPFLHPSRRSKTISCTTGIPEIA